MSWGDRPRLQSPVHFWSPEDLASAMEAWDPDSDPGKHQSGVGHGLYELYVRLRARGRPVTIGPVPPPGCHLVFHLESVWDWRAGGPDRRALFHLLGALSRSSAATAVRGDVPLELSVRPGHCIEVMPNRTTVTRVRQVWVPLLPQRGLAGRKEVRKGRVRSVGLMAYEENVPELFRSAEFLRQVREIPVDWRAHTLKAATSAPDWHDFADLDCVLCLRSEPVPYGAARKPATKLINAWAAGAIPIVGDEPAYREMGEDGVDCLFVSRPEGVLPLLRRLATDSSLVELLERGGELKSRQYSRERILDAWEALIFDRAPASRLMTSLSRIAVSAHRTEVGTRIAMTRVLERGRRAVVARRG